MFALFFLRLLGWKPADASVPLTDRSVTIAYPHTCYMDTIVAYFIACHLGGNVAAKVDTPFFRFVIWLFGMIPIRRTNGAVSQTDQIASALKKRPQHLFIAPEGARKRAAKIRSGFYHIAQKTGYPIICASIDYRTKTYSFSEPFDVSEHTFEETLGQLEAYYRETGLDQGAKHPERVTPLVLNKDD